ncbi:Two component regulator propeller [Flexibacter flexilis DSM 6793]|uniref:histidine kinase n=1 Tax=Flexibacter flexilis DSM 6793 TaxID=927664 RepID=A0A1I1KRF3_9BACT|nr:sensor histidine kinase [Flexibacter flexilis]SFC63414.1 Two component regulator propeller [Flexibacter flexilis DSM 6793]
MKRTLIVICTLLLFYCLTERHTFAQTLTFKHYNRASGLSSDYIFNIYQDSKGYIWFATDNGVSRYNGQYFDRYSTNEGLSANLVYHVLEDNAGQIWFGTYEGGASILKDGKIAQYTRKNSPQCNITIMNIAQDNLGNIYLNGDSGVAILQTNHQWLRIKNGSTTHNSTLLNTSQQQPVLASLGNDLYAIYLLDNQKYHIKQISKPSHGSFSSAQFYAISPNEYWVRCHSGLKKIKLVGDSLQVKSISNEWLTGIAILPDKSIITSPNLSGTLHHYSPDGKLLRDWNTNYTLSAICSDYEGNIWLGTFGKGVLKVSAQHFLNQPADQLPIQTIWQDAQKRVWVGSQTNFWLMKDTAVAWYSRNSDYFHIRGFAQNADNQYFYGTLSQMYGGIPFERMHDDNLAIPHQRISSGMSDILRHPNGDIWVSTYGSGISIFDKNGNKKQVIERSNGLVSNMIEGMEVCRNGTVWAYSRTDGLSKIQGNKIENFTSKNGLPANDVGCVYGDSTTHNWVWIGTSKGIIKLSPEGKVQKIKPNNFEPEGRIINIFTDKYGQLFFLSEHRLYKWEQGQIRKAGSFLLLPKSNISINTAHYDPQHNWLYIGSTEGLYILSLDNFKFNNIPPKVCIESLQANELVFKNPKSTIELKHYQHNIKINYAALSFIDEAQIRYRYILSSEEQPDNDTVYTQNHSIELRSLAWGKYTFWVEAINPDGVASAPKALVKFRIQPPIWATWWFRLIISLILVGIVGGVVRYFSNRKLKKKLAALELQHRLQIERERISRDLHDNVGSQLTYIISSLDLSNRRPDADITPKEKQRLSSLAQSARQTMSNLREAIWILQKDATSIEEFTNKLQRYVQQQISTQPQLSARFEFEIQNCPDLSPVQALHLFRIGQEAVNNAVKYAEATLLTIRLEREGNILWFSITDNGKGLPEDTNPEGYGLRNMRQRAQEMNGRCVIRNNENDGTLVQVSVPL